MGTPSRTRIGRHAAAMAGGAGAAADQTRVLAYERQFWARGVSQVAGVDEVGRGPLAGPVVAAAVVLPEGVSVEGAADSKALAPGEREEIAVEVRRRALALALGAASAREIDRINILRATTLAMTRALGRLPSAPGHVVVDGLPVRGLEWDHDAVVGGDALVHSVACASIVAKVCRDGLMTRLAARYPGYGWETNMGYATRRHREAVRSKGLTPHHRITFGLLQMELPLKEARSGRAGPGASQADEASPHRRPPRPGPSERGGR